jgi:hypothetical protein
MRLKTMFTQRTTHHPENIRRPIIVNKRLPFAAVPDAKINYAFSL